MTSTRTSMRRLHPTRSNPNLNRNPDPEPPVGRPVRSPRPRRACAPRIGAALLITGVLLAGGACSRETGLSAGPGSTSGPGTAPGTGPGSIVERPTGSTPRTAPRTVPTSSPGTPPSTGPGSGTPGTMPRTTTTFVASPPPVPATTDEGAIYLALIRHSLDRTMLDPPRPEKPYREIVIVDHGVAGAADPTAIGSTAPDGPAFSEAIRTDLVNGLGDLGPVRFVPDAKAGAVTSQPGNERVLVIVGPIEKVGADGTTVHVGLSKTCGPLCGSGGTSVLEHRNGGWVVTGAVGGGWIS